jgi:predicted O-methyltransferase YrrM
MPSRKPLFSGPFIAFSEFDRRALTILLRSLGKPFCRVAEIGSWLGNGSTRTFIEELQGHGILYCVDHWRGNDNVERHQALVSHYDIFATFQANVAAAGGSELVKPLMMSSQEAARIVHDQIFDLVFLDGDHSYEQTRLDIEAWLPKVALGGILCGHDCEGRADCIGHDFLWQHRYDDSVPGSANFDRIHPGTILAVTERFGQTARLFAEELLCLEGSAGYSTIWAWRKPRPGLVSTSRAFLQSMRRRKA